MCEFLSWKEKDGQVLYLDDDDLESPKGRELKEYLGSAYDDDKKGHGSITWWYPSSANWMNKECTGFSDPSVFPVEIVAKIKLGKFWTGWRKNDEGILVELPLKPGLR